MPFVLWKEGDTANRTAARLYGDGITKGLVMYYRDNYRGTNRTAYIAILADGARREGDRGCSRMRRVIYAGYELSEFDPSGARQWKFHPGEMTAVPDVVDGYTVTTGSLNLINLNPSPFLTGTLVRVLPYGGNLPPELDVNTVYYLQRVGPFTRLWTQVNGVQQAVVTYTADGAFAMYDTAGVGFEDPVQGNSWLFPEVNWAGSGLAWIEVLLPESLSDGEDEPSRADYVMSGKLCQDISATATQVEFTGDWVETTSPPLVLADMMYWDGHMGLDRFNPNWATAFKPRADFELDWVGGGGDGLMATYFSDTTFSTAVLTRKEVVVFNTWDGVTPPAPGVPAHHFCIRYEGFIKVTETGSYKFTVSVDNGAKLTIDGQVLINGLMATDEPHPYPQVMESINKTLSKDQFYPFALEYQNYVGPGELHLQYENDGSILKQFIPQAVLYSLATAVRKAKRYDASVVFTSPTPMDTAIEAVFFRCPGVRWQDVNAKLKVLVDATTEVTAERLVYDPASLVSSNIISFSFDRKDVETLYNFYAAMYRNLDDVFLAKSGPLFESRVGLIAAQGWNLTPFPPFEMGVMQESLAARILATFAVMNSDFDISYSVEALITTYALARGDFADVVDVSAGYTEAEPTLGLVEDEGFTLDGLPARNFKVRAASKEYYSDEKHGPVRAVVRGGLPGQFRVPGVVTTYEVHDVGRFDALGNWFAALEGTLTVPDGSAVSVRVEYSVHGADDYKVWGSLDPSPDSREVSFLIPVESDTEYDVRLVSFNRRTGSSKPLPFHPVVQVTVDVAPPPDVVADLTMTLVGNQLTTSWVLDDPTVDFFQLSGDNGLTIIWEGATTSHTETVNSGFVAVDGKVHRYVRLMRFGRFGPWTEAIPIGGFPDPAFVFGVAITEGNVRTWSWFLDSSLPQEVHDRVVGWHFKSANNPFYNGGAIDVLLPKETTSYRAVRGSGGFGSESGNDVRAIDGLGFQTDDQAWALTSSTPPNAPTISKDSYLSTPNLLSVHVDAGAGFDFGLILFTHVQTRNVGGVWPSQLDNTDRQNTVAGFSKDVKVIGFPGSPVEIRVGFEMTGGNVVWSSNTLTHTFPGQVVTPEGFGAKLDAELFPVGATIAAASDLLTVAGRLPTAADVGKKVVVMAAGPNGTIAPFPPTRLLATVQSVSSTQFKLSVVASNAVAGGRVVMGTDDTAAFQAAANALTSGGLIRATGKAMLGTVNLLSNTTVKTDPTHTMFYSVSSSMFIMSGKNNVVVDGISLDACGNPIGSGGTTYVGGTTMANIVVKNSVFDDTFLYNNIAPVTTFNRHAILARNYDGLTISGCRFYHALRVKAHGGTGNAFNADVFNNYFYDTNENGFSLLDSTMTGIARNINFHHNIFEGIMTTGNCVVIGDDGFQLNVTAATNAAATELTFSTNHGLTTGQLANVGGATGTWAAINGVRAVTVTATNKVTIPVDTSAFGALTGLVRFYGTQEQSNITINNNIFRGILPANTAFIQNRGNWTQRNHKINGNIFDNAIAGGGAAAASTFAVNVASQIPVSGQTINFECCNNEVTGSYDAAAIRLGNIANGLVTNNTIAVDSCQRGIRVGICTNLRVASNFISGCLYGLYFNDGTLTGCIAADNTIQLKLGNNVAGIYLDQQSVPLVGFAVSRNRIVGNGVGPTNNYGIQDGAAGNGNSDQVVYLENQFINIDTAGGTASQIYKDLPAHAQVVNHPSQAYATLTGATPSARGLSTITLQNGSATTVTDLPNGYAGQSVVVTFADSNTTIANNANIVTASGANFNGSATKSLRFVYTSAGKWLEISSSAAGGTGGGGGISLVAAWTTGIAATTGLFYMPGTSLGGSGTETQRQVRMSACTLKALRVHIGGAQPASGTLVITLKVNGVNSALQVTVPASAAANSDYDFVFNVVLADGDKISLEAVNNASGVSASNVSVTVSG